MDTEGQASGTTPVQHYPSVLVLEPGTEKHIFVKCHWKHGLDSIVFCSLSTPHFHGHETSSVDRNKRRLQINYPLLTQSKEHPPSEPSLKQATNQLPVLKAKRTVVPVVARKYLRVTSLSGTKRGAGLPPPVACADHLPQHRTSRTPAVRTSHPDFRTSASSLESCPSSSHHPHHPCIAVEGVEWIPATCGCFAVSGV